MFGREILEAESRALVDLIQTDAAPDSSSCWSRAKTSTAVASGMQPGDVITKVQEPTVRTVEVSFGELRKVEPGDKVALTLRWDGQTNTLTVTAGRLAS